MNISFSREEYRTLLEVFQIAAWVLQAHRTEEAPDTKRYRMLEQKIFSLAEEAGFGDLIEYAPGPEQFFPTRKFDEESPVMEFIEDYNDDMFWDELAERLAYRDILETTSEEELEKMPREERFIRIDNLCEAYLDEFCSRGVDKLRLEE
jgi:hypothetical protein